MSPDQESSLGTQLRRLREAAGLTQEELAFRGGLTPNAVSDLERGRTRRPYPHTVRSLADALGLSEEERTSLLVAIPRRDSPAPETSAVPRYTLPRPPTPLVGREKELGEISELLSGGSEVRLLTLTGIGGVGKTRLALEAAHEAESYFPDGVAFVDLAPLRESALVDSTIASSLGLRETEGQSASGALRAHLVEKRILLVLDNFEHLLEAAVEVVHLIESCPMVVVVATSRAPLRVRSEREYPVSPLSLPPSASNPTGEEVLRTPSGQLFLERAQAASPSFALTSENAGAVAAICWRLAGLPLALELAAAKVRFLEPPALLLRLDEALSMAWARDLPERQRNMRATLDWSYEILSEPERKIFRRLSVFAGGFTLEAAEDVGVQAAAEAGEDPAEVLGALGALVEQSLVMVLPPKARGGARYGMLEPVRQYALERLEESGDADEVRRRHATYFLDLAEKAEPELRGSRQVEWLQRLEEENGNLRAAMSWTLDTEDAETAARLGWALWLFWRFHGHQHEGRRWMEVLLDRDVPPTLRPRAVHAAMSMAYMQGDYEAVARYSAELLKLSQEVEDALCTAYGWCGLGLVAMDRRNFGEATSSFEEALALLRRAGEEGVVPVVRIWLGTVALIQGEHDRAIPMFEEGLAQARKRGDRLGTYNALYNLAQVALARGNHDLAIRMLEEGVTLSEEIGDQANLSYFLEGLAVIAGMEGDSEHSARLLGAAERLLEEAGAPVYNYYKSDRSLYDRTTANVRSGLGEEGFEEAWAEGRTMSFEQAAEYALERDAASSPGSK